MEKTTPRDLDWLRASSAATVNIKAVAEVLEVDERTVLRAIEDGQLPVVRVGRRVLVPRLPLLAMLTGQRPDVTGVGGSPAA